jgi:RNA polymerase sigma factor (sigma-70 family)
MDDADLLRRYAAGNDAEAFAEIIRRHHAFVYHVALRQTEGNSAVAEDAARNVFQDLAEKAGRLGGRPLIGWLYTSARFAAANAYRSERRRKVREREAQRMRDVDAPEIGDAEWQRLRPVIDEVLDSLPESDRCAVLLRYFENHSWGEIAAQLGLAEDTVRKRVDRSLERMAGGLGRHGIHSTAAAIAAAMATQATLAAPASLTASLGAMAAYSTAATATAVGLLSMKTSITALTLVALFTTGAAVYQFEQARQAKAIAAAVAVERDTLRATARKVEQRAIQAEQDLAALQGAVDAAKSSIQAAATAAALPNGEISSFLGRPIAAPANLDPRYQPEGLIGAFQEMSKNAGIVVGKIAVDTSEFPFIVYGTIDRQHTFRDIEAGLKALPGYTYGGSVTFGQGAFAVNMIPMSAVPKDEQEMAQRRLMIRLQVVADRVQP